MYYCCEDVYIYLINYFFKDSVHQKNLIYCWPDEIGKFQKNIAIFFFAITDQRKF